MSTDLSALAPLSGEMPAGTPPADGADRPGFPVESSPSSESLSSKDQTSTALVKQGQAIVKRRAARIKAPKDSKVYKVVLAVVALRAQGVKAKEISDTLGYSEDVLRQYVSRAYKKGWINISSFSDVDDQLEYVLKHKVVKNINEFLNREDKEVTLEAAKGLGLFKSHQVVKGENVSQIGVALSVSVVMPPEAKQNSRVSIRPGTIGGASAVDVPIDAEIVNPEQE